MVAAAVGAVAVAGVASSAMAANQAGKANASQQQAAQSQLQLAQQQYDNQQQQISPYLAAGQTGLTDYGDLLGANGNDAQNAAIGGIKNGAQYQGLMQTGNENILANASATGGLRGSNTSNTLANTSIGTLNGLITQRLAGYGQLMTNGQNAVNGLQAASKVYQQNSDQAWQNSANAYSQYDTALSNSFKSGLGSITQGINAFAGGGSV
ncbi:hypothetical protein [Paraburkholderia sp. BL9I2N2]|uniref:hypothetical protein n=1 Tax=Paraburkholderia sp. BL9I2N2 TaxID=1938809 RepID=UPI00104CF529|nr:hypothetical protein [Paraburkholderia sp. BL9I2N2]TCK87359.1 hypothetical protein B0G74_7898 [Paraburkholderia sp. BL9I2N2]